jgi:membrane protease YdiL (CAAX protease family)
MRASFIKPSFLKNGAIAFAIAAAISVAVVAVGQGVWGVMAMINLKVSPAIPWAAPLMALILAGLLAYLGGSGWPASTSAARRRLLRWNPMPWATFGLAVAAGVLGLVAFGGLWIATADLVHIPAGVQPSLRGMPLPTAITLLIMGSLAAPLSEEAAFRGYAMGILEKAWGWAPAAIVGSSVLFAAVHFVQGLDAIKLGLYFLAGVVFATVAYLTNSLYAAMAVHSLGDVLGFTVLWPHDQAHHGMGFHDPMFAPALAAIAVFTPLAILAFRKLHAVGEDLRSPKPAVPAQALGALPIAA